MSKRVEFTKDNQVIGGITFLNSGSYAELNIYGQILDEDEPKESDGDTTNTQVVELLKHVGNRDLIVHINSGGGSVFAGIGIYNAIRHMCKGKIIVKIMGIAGSIASVVAMAGDVIIMPVNTQMMIHKPSVAAEGNADDLMNLVKVLENIQKIILNTYMTKVRKNITRAYINKLMNETSWLSPFECQKIFKNIKVEENGGFDNMTRTQFKGYVDDYENETKKKKHSGWDDEDDRRKSRHKDEDEDEWEDTYKRRKRKSTCKDDEDEDFEDSRRRKARHKDEDDEDFDDAYRKKKTHHKNDEDEDFDDAYRRKKRKSKHHEDEDDEDEDFDNSRRKRKTKHDDEDLDDYEHEEYRKHKKKEKVKKRRVKNMIDDFDDEIAQFLGMED